MNKNGRFHFGYIGVMRPVALRRSGTSMWLLKKDKLFRIEEIDLDILHRGVEKSSSVRSYSNLTKSQVERNSNMEPSH